MAVVPQTNRRGRTILNLSAKVQDRQKFTPCHARGKHSQTRVQVQVHPWVNQMTMPTDDQSGVAALGLTLTSILCYMFETDCMWEIEWQKIDLSEGFWRMVVEVGEEYNFVFQMPQ
jgi:hypothetical protein